MSILMVYPMKNKCFNSVSFKGSEIKTLGGIGVNEKTNPVYALRISTSLFLEITV
jgi:hypothetical protein